MIDLTYKDKVVGEIRQSNRADWVTIGYNMSEQDAIEYWSYDRSSPVVGARKSFEKSKVCMTIEHNGAPCAMFGIMVIDKIPTLWMLKTDDLQKIGRVMARNTREWINKMLAEYPKLISYCDIRNESSIRWMIFVGGKIIDTVFMGMDDMPFRKFEFTCKN